MDAGDSILGQLSCRVGDRASNANQRVVGLCLEAPGLLEQIAAGLQAADPALMGDCAEVMTEVAKEKPALVVPYAPRLAHLIEHKKTRVRWEATHALALVTPLAPEIVADRLPQIGHIIRDDKSVIVRDYAVDALAAYAATGRSAASAAFPWLLEMLTAWEGKQAARALAGLEAVAEQVPENRAAIRQKVEGLANHPKSGVRRAAKRLIRRLDSLS